MLATPPESDTAAAHMPAPSTTWPGAVDLLHHLASEDLRSDGVLRPVLLAFRGRQLLVGIVLRAPSSAEREEPLVEALALSLPLGADRLAVLAGGRTWPTPGSLPPQPGPASDGTAGAKRAALVLRVDGHGPGPVDGSCVLLPYACHGHGRHRSVQWLPRAEIAELGTGWIATLLPRALTARGRLARVPALEVGRQGLRLRRLGHGLLLPEPTDGSPVLAALRAAADLSGEGSA